MDDVTCQDWTCLSMDSDPLSVRAGLVRLLSMPPLAGADADLRERVEIVLVEVLNNIVEHAYGGTAGRIRLSLGLTVDGGVRCQVTDCGMAFPRGELPQGNLPPLERRDLPEGGFGWHMIRMLAEDLCYQREEGQNELSFWISL